MVGNTSKLVLPFLLAYDANNQSVGEFCADNLVLLKDCKETLSYAQSISEAFIVGTSYEHYVRALCKEIGFPLENTYCTKVNLDKFKLTEKEKSKIKSYAWEISGMPPINTPANAKSLKDLSSRDHTTVKRLDKIFWDEIAGTNCRKVFSDVNIAGWAEKILAIQEIVSTYSSPLKDVMYVCDDATDVEAAKLVRTGGGLTVSINGDGAAVRTAEVAVLSDNSRAISVLADIFLRFGRAEALNAAGNFDRDFLWRSPANPVLLDHLFELYPMAWPKVYVISEWNMESIVDESNQFRKTVKGELFNKQA
jgi:energy-converting hydrogenase A subunit R